MLIQASFLQTLSTFHFIAESYFHEKFEKIGTDVGDLLDFFTVPVRSENLELDCFRFNAVINKSVEFIKARSSGDYFQVTLKPYKDYIDVTRDKYVLFSEACQCVTIYGLFFFFFGKEIFFPFYFHIFRRFFKIFFGSLFCKNIYNRF